MIENMTQKITLEELKKFNNALKEFKEYYSLCDAYQPDRDCDRCELQEECMYD